ncbi:MAG: TIM barrel protein [Pseudomonadota bacterium]|nr:TIM barrel protein [Pseudomonadota bacterium]
MKFSANLGFLWTEHSLPDAISAAKAAGFDAVECHWPYAVPVGEVAAALEETGLKMLGLNTRQGNPGENGLSALPGRSKDARAAVDEALAYAAALNTPNVHVMAGFAEGPDAHAAFVDTLKYASAKAAPLGITILIEPLNSYAAPGYFLTTTDQAVAIMDEVGADNIRLMFDCYHVQLMEGDICNRLTKLMPKIGHVQFAGVPSRGEPDQGELNYSFIFDHLKSLSYAQPLGAEYKPSGPTDASLDWMASLR